MNKAMIFLLVVLALFMVTPANDSYCYEPEEQIKSTVEALSIKGVEHQMGEGYTEIMIQANAPFEYTSYDPDPGMLIIEIPEGDVNNIPNSIDINTPQVTGLKVKTINGAQGGFFIGRFEITYHPEAQHTLSMAGNDLHIRIDYQPDNYADVEMKEEKAQEEAQETPYAKQAEETNQQELPRAAQVYGMRVDDSHPSYLDITILGDGKLSYHDFQVEDPYRIVIDLENISMNLANKNYEVNNPYVEKVRTGQFQIVPEKIGRVVFDMKNPCSYEITHAGNSLKVRFGKEEETALAASSPKKEEAHSIQEAYQPKKVSQPAEIASVSEVAHHQDVAPPEQKWSEAPPSKKESPPEELTKPAEPLIAQKEEEAAAQPSHYTREEFEKIIDQKAKEDYVILKEEPEKFAAPTEEKVPFMDFERKTITPEEERFTGKKISLNLVDADIKQVFRLFHEISGLNFVLDPSVGGKVTIVLDNVPWDQALDIILKNNGLDKVVERNVIRIAPTQKLAQEAAARKQLKQAKELEVDPITITRTLSYAKAQEIERIIKQSGMISSRGRVIMDERTNSLIVTDVPTRIPPIDNLIITLDTETPQVMIEARMVETSREFLQDFGIDWGFTGIADSSLGTQTNLQFPHSAIINYDLRLPNTPPTELAPNELTLSFGNVLKSFTLDMTLEALEVEGKARVLSAPKIATQNNEKAEIERGTQIPVVNTTATEINVEYVSASLKLQVTPQITAEGTIILDIIVENNSPDYVNTVGDVPPINTQRAQTKVLVDDGGTTVIGGIFSQSEGISELGVPWFRKIPLLGWLFKNRSISNENRELLIFLTPKIMRSSNY